MAEASKVRLVRCPKCENLLPELPDISLYECGGCGAVLRGKTKGIPENGLSEVNNNLKSGEGSIVDAPEVEMETAGGLESRRLEGIRNETVASERSSTPRESRELLVDSDVSRRGKERIRKVERFDDDDEYRLRSEDLIRNRNRGKNCDLNVDRPEYAYYGNEHAVEEIRPPVDSLRSRPVMHQWGAKSNGSAVSYRPTTRGGTAMQGRHANFLYHDEGPSSNETSSYYRHDERTRYQSHHLDGIASIETLENGRAELLRKLDELKDQLSQSCDLNDKPKERVGIGGRTVSPFPPDLYTGRQFSHVQEGFPRSHGINRQPFSPDDVALHYPTETSEFSPYTDRYVGRVQEPYIERGYPHEVLRYGDPYRRDMPRGPPEHPRSHYMHQSYPEHHPGYYGDVDHDLFMLQRHENLFHQPGCSCVHCFNKNWHLPPKVVPSGMHNQRAQNGPSNPNFHHSLNPALHRKQGYSSGGSNMHQSHSRQPFPFTLNSSELDSDNDGFNYHRPRKLVVAHKNGRVWYPIAGGSPFVTCSNCFELLKLPRKYILLAKNQQKMKCGACSSIILFELGNKGYVASVSTRIDEAPAEIDDGSSGTGDENVRYWHGGSNIADMNACSDDCDDFGNKLSPADKKPNSVESEKQLDPLSPTSSLSGDEQEPSNLPSGQHGPPSAKLPLTHVKSFARSDLSSQECPDHSSDNAAIGRFEKGNRSKRSEQERISHDRSRATSRQNSVTDAALATEMDVSLNEFSNSCVSQDSVETSKEDNPRPNKGGESFLTGLIRKGFKELKKSNHNAEAGDAQVYVNGHLIPDRVVKKAEKLAGPIQPGEYWYDIQAGFWGVMGHPCLGIIMPNIEEFNYPIPEKCAAGNTEVYVNGRELHQKDLDLLASRGLPITRHRSYIVEMSGKVVDEHTGEELDGLGKLAPTVEKAKHGFGMKVPRFIAEARTQTRALPFLNQS